MGGTYSLFIGAALMGISMNLGSGKPYDWLTTPAQRYKEEVPGNKDLSVNYAPSVPAFDAVENYKRHTGSNTFRTRALAYQGSNSRDPTIRSQAANEMVVNNRRWGSRAIGDSVMFSTQ